MRLNVKDNQLKIRGYRVELEEIREQLTAQAKIREAEILAYHDALYAFVVSDDDIDSREIIRSLSQSLAQYMLPEIQVIDQMPKNVNGKTDKDKLIEWGSKDGINIK